MSTRGVPMLPEHDFDEPSVRQHPAAFRGDPLSSRDDGVGLPRGFEPYLERFGVLLPRRRSRQDEHVDLNSSVVAAWLPNTLQVAGLLLVAAGVWLVSAAASLVVVGAALLIYAQGIAATDAEEAE